MSDYTTNSTVNLSINGKDVEEKLDKYKKKLVELRQKAQKAAEIGDKGTLQKTQKEIVKVENQMRRLRNATANVDETLRNLDKAGPKQLKKDLRTLKSQLENIERGSDAWNAHIEKIKILETELKKINSEMKVSEGFWDSLNRKMNDWQTTLAAGIAAMTGVVMAGRSAVNAYAEMDAEMANVRKFTGMTAEQVEDLNEEFKKIDTRTSREELNKLAQEAGRLGKQSKEDVLGFVKAADIINVALDDLGDGATLTLSKLTNIFGDEKIYGTEQSLLKVGSVINELSQNCTAAAPYLANFTQRLGGVGKQANMTIPELMGFGAVLDSQGQAVEMSATALSKLIMDLFGQTKKIAKATGMDLNEFNKALKKSTNEGLIMLLERLHELGNIDVLAPIFKDMGEDGARASAVIASLADKIEMVKWEQQEANKAYQEGNSVINEFNVQNSTVQAGLDKAKKSVEEMAVELGEKLMPVMSHVLSSTTMLMKAMSISVNFIKDNAYTLLSLVAAFVAFRIAVNASNIAFKAHYALLVASEAITKGYTATVSTLKAAKLLLSIAVAKLNGNYARQNMLMLDLKKNTLALKGVYGLAAAAIGFLIVKLIQYKKEKDEIRRKYNEEIRQDMERMKAYSDEYAKITALNRILHDNKKSYEDRKAALDKLKAIVPDYHAELKKEGELINDNTIALDKYLEAFKKSVRAKANQEKYEKLIKEEAELQEQRAEAEKKYWDIRTTNTAQGYNRNSVTAKVTGAIAKALGDKDTEEGAKQYLDELDSKIGEVQAKIKDLDMVVAPSLVENEEANKNNNTNPPTGDEDKKKKDKFEKEKAWKEKELALNRIAYATGKKDYEAYQNAILEIEKEFQNKILSRKDLTEQERLNATAEFEEANLKLTQNGRKAQAKAVEDYYKSLKAIEDQRYIDGKITTEQYNEALNHLELKHFRELVAIYEEGSRERNEAQAKYDDALIADQKRKRKKIEDAEKEHRKKMDEISRDVFGNTPSKQKAMFNAELAALSEVYNQEKILAANSKEDLLRIEENFQKAKLALAYKYDQINAENGFNNMQIANEKLFKWLESEQGQAILGAYDVVMDGMTNIFSACSDIIQAELEIETAAIEKRYEKEISAAEGNRYKVKKLEEKKQKEEAAAKNKANKKMYAMQVMQAIASTAMGAINAYSSAAQVPLIGYILAPIAAATAIAAGMLQVANIKKQQQASEAQGYSEGGYTPAGGKHEPKGIVHAGEWVASQKLLANPQAAAIIQSLDYAQKTNTIGSISQSMVSSDTTAAASIARLASGSSSSSDNSIGETLAALNKRLREPFVTINTMTGDHGIKQAQDEYDIYIRNKTPKSRRT
jgi:TP901 family phage tail tape measure protein